MPPQELKREDQRREDGTINFGDGWHSDAFKAVTSIVSTDHAPTPTKYGGGTVFWSAEASHHVLERCKFFNGAVVPTMMRCIDPCGKVPTISNVWTLERDAHFFLVRGDSGSGKTVTLLHQRSSDYTFYLRASDLLRQLGTDGRPLSTWFEGHANSTTEQQGRLAASIVALGVRALLGGAPYKLGGFCRILVVIDDADEHPAFVRAVCRARCTVYWTICDRCFGECEPGIIASVLSSGVTISLEPVASEADLFFTSRYAVVEPCPDVWGKCCEMNPRFASVLPMKMNRRDTELQRQARAFVGNARGAWAFAEVLQKHPDLERVIDDASLCKLLAEAVKVLRDAAFSLPRLGDDATSPL